MGATRRKRAEVAPNEVDIDRIRKARSEPVQGTFDGCRVHVTVKPYTSGAN
ncbi:MAG: hypothetical protein RL005_1375, partial [Planctomycetota bacterium]